MLGPLWRAGWHDGVMKWIVEHATIDPEKQLRYADLVNVQNGMLNIYDGSLVAHETTYKSFVQLPITYREQAASQHVLDFVSSIVTEDAIPAFWEYMGFLLLPDYRYKRVLLLVGPGNTGKSALLSFIRKFLGKENTSSVSLQDLTSNEFLRVELFGKLANIYADLSLSALESSGEVKSLTGGDEIIAHRKYGQPFSFTNRAKLIFSANDFSAVAKPDPTFFERFVVISCEHVFTAGRAIPNVVDTFDSSDLSAFLNYALQGLQRLIANAGFSVSEQAESIKEMKQEFKETADNIVSFISNATVVERDARVSKADLYAAYRMWTDRAGTTPVSSVRFFRRIKQGLEEFHMSEQYVLTSGTEEHKQTWVYIGRNLLDSGSIKDGVIKFGQPL
jgi:putative DNA primase/helicase